MLEFLNLNNISFEQAGFAKVSGENAVVNLSNDTLTGIKPRNYRWTERMRLFSYYRLYLVTDGQVELNVNNKLYVMTKGNMYLIKPFSIKSATPPELFTHYYLHFNIKGLSFNFFDYYNLEDFVEYNEQDLVLFQQLLHNFNTDNLGKHLITTGVFSLLLSKFFNKETQMNPSIKRFAPVLKFIDENPSLNMSLDQLADIMHLNKVYFSTLFQKTFKTSPIKYVIEKKMLLAQQLLASQKLTIQEISDKLGYTNEYYFSSAFKHTFGTAPSKWREMYLADQKR